MAVFNNILAGAAGQSGGAAAGYQIERSLRFNAADSAYLSKNFGSAGNQTTWTLSCWFKISEPGTDFRCTPLFSGTQPWSGISIYQDSIRFAAYSGSAFILQLQTTQKLRDPSAWYHLVAVYDSTNGTSTDRARLYLNGTRITDFVTATYPGPNVTSTINGTGAQRIGWEESNNAYSSCDFADVHFIDGLALSPIFFGEYDDNGVWQPKAFDDGGTTVNDGTTWSDSVTTADGESTANTFDRLFDGSLSTVASNPGNTGADEASAVTFTPASPINYINSVEVYHRGALGDAVGKASLNDGATVNCTLGQWNTIGTGPGSITKIEMWVDPGTTGIGENAAAAIRVDGIVLLDSTTQTLSYGTNGFHLDFADNSSKDALGYDAAGSNDWTVNNFNVTVTPNYASGLVSGTGSFQSAYPAINAFKGGTATLAIQTTTTGNPTLTWTPPTPLTGVTSLRVNDGNVGDNPYATGYIRVNGGSQLGISEVGGNTFSNSWRDLTSYIPAGNTITSISWEQVNKGGYTLSLNLIAIEVNGVILEQSLASDYDSLRDSPTNGDTANDTGLGGEVPGNYSTWNPLEKQSEVTLANGNLDVSFTGSSGHAVKSTIALTSGKWYWEVTVGGNAAVGIQETSYIVYQWPGTTSYSYGYVPDGRKVNNLSYSSYGSAFSNGDVVGVAFDATNGKIWFRLNGTWQNSGDPAAGTNAAFSSLTTGIAWSPSIGYWSNTVGTVNSTNFGQRAFAFQAPSGFQPLATPFLDDPTIADGSTAFEVITYQGNGTTQTLPNTDSTTSPQDPLNFAPDLVWAKQRNTERDHCLVDTVRGASKRLRSDSDYFETTESVVTAFNSDSFDIGNDNGVNQLNGTYVAWNWKAGGQPTTDNIAGAGNVPTAGSVKIDGANMTTSLAGSIPATRLSANTAAGFSIVTYTGNGNNTNTATSPAVSIGHGLPDAPSMIIVKDRDSTRNWPVYHIGIGTTSMCELDTGGAAQPTYSWNQQAPSPSVFYVGNNGQTNNNGNNYVAYCFAPVEGYSAFGIYSNNNVANGPFVYTGFRPRYVLIKTTSASSWVITDSRRSPFNVANNMLFAEVSNSEGSDAIDFLSNGFKLRSASGDLNYTGRNYIYAAFAENPFKIARAR